MTFRETLEKLLEETKEMDIFAMIAYDDSKVGMGFRASYYNEPHNDPIIDGNVFMIAGDAYDNRDWKRLQTTEGMLNTYMDFICVRPRAVYYNPYMEIQLGDYIVESMKVEQVVPASLLVEVRTVPERIRLHIKRK